MRGVGAMGLVAYSSTFRTRVVRKTLTGRNVSSLLRGRGVSALLQNFIRSVSKISILITSYSCRTTVRLLERGRVVPRRRGFYPFYNSSQVGFILGGRRHIETIDTTVISVLTAIPPKNGR